MFARVAARTSRAGAKIGRSFSAQAAARPNQLKFATVAAASVALAAGLYAFQSNKQAVVVCEAGEAPKGAAPAAAAAAAAGDFNPKVRNSAFVFIKPHAVTTATKGLVAARLKANGLNIISEGEIKAEEIDSKMLIDQHYYAIASKATIMKPNQLNVPADKFKKQFGIGWQDALAKGVVFNAADACTHLGIDADELNKYWGAAKKADKLAKFGGGFYCGLVEVPGKTPIYVFNGFFMTMRKQFVKPGVSIYYYSVEWDGEKLPWADFRGKVLGPTDPETAPKDSLRGAILKDWQNLGLGYKPNVGDNGVHASASPFEALAERMNWLGATVETDPFGKTMLAAGVSTSTIKDWSVDPQVTYGAPDMPISGSLFDSLEDTNADVCAARLMMINAKAAPATPYLQLGGVFVAGAIAGTLLGGGSK